MCASELVPAQTKGKDPTDCHERRDHNQPKEMLPHDDILKSGVQFTFANASDIFFSGCFMGYLAMSHSNRVK